MRHLIIALMLVVGMAAAAHAQTDIVPGPTTKLAFDHDGVNTTGYVLRVDGTPLDLGMVPVVTGVVREIPFPAITPGIHSLTVRAYNADGQSPDSNVLSIRVIVLPVAPTNLRLAMGFNDAGEMIWFRFV